MLTYKPFNQDIIRTLGVNEFLYEGCLHPRMT